MIIGVDGNEANITTRVGVSVYTLRLLEYFRKKANRQIRFKVFLKQRPKNLPKETGYFKYEVVPGKYLWSQAFLPVRLFLKKDVDIFFSPAHYLPRFCPVASVVTIHDLSYLYYPGDFLKKDLYQLKNWTKYSLRQARRVIAVSKTTKKDIVRFYDLPEEKIDVIYNGGPRRHPEPFDFAQGKLGVEGSPFILYVGTLQPRKNIGTLLEAFSRFKQSYPEFKLVVAGKKGWLYEEIFRKVKNLKLERDVKFTGYTSDSKLEELYKNAFFFVLPSFYEGFGIPVLEAMSKGCPVVASFASSLPEVGGDAVLYFDPESATDLLAKMKILKEDNALRVEFIKKGLKRVKDFSWEKCGRETLEVIKKTYASSTVR